MGGDRQAAPAWARYGALSRPGNRGAILSRFPPERASMLRCLAPPPVTQAIGLRSPESLSASMTNDCRVRIALLPSRMREGSLEAL